MRHDYGVSEDGVIGKPYDPKLIRRLVPYGVKHKGFILISSALVLLITLLDLCIPYMTKIAIDDYIVPVFQGEKTDKTDGKQKERLFKVLLADESMRSIVKKYPDFFTHRENVAIISYENLLRLSPEDRRVIRKNDFRGLVMIAIIFLGAITLNVVLNFFQKLTMEYTGHKMMHDLRMDLYIHIQSLSLSFFSKRPVAQLVTRMTNDIQKMHDLFTSVISFVFKDLFLLIGIGLVLMVIDLELALISFAVLPVVLLTALIFQRYIRDIFRQIKIKVSQINTRFSETILGMKVIQIFQKEALNQESFDALNQEKYEWGIKQINGFAIFMPLIGFFGMSAVAMVIYFGGGRILTQTMSLGDLVAFITYIRMFFRPIRDLAEKYNILQNAMASAERVFELFDNDEKIVRYSKGRSKRSPLNNSRRRKKKIKTIAFNSVDFSYLSGERILENISFKLNSGEKLSVVGPTGAGKTSLIQLLLRFYDPLSGEINIDGKNIREMELNDLRSRVALVTQDPFLFSGTLEENILMGKKETFKGRFSEIIEASHLKPVIDRLPKGIHSSILEGGKSLSSGERQLISIARALFRDAEVILLDEATSYIDSQTEHHLKKALENLMADRTAIIVAHRLVTARNTDRILVLNQGRIAEIGDHKMLMKKRGFYYNLNQFMAKPHALESEERGDEPLKRSI